MVKIFEDVADLVTRFQLLLPPFSRVRIGFVLLFGNIQRRLIAVQGLIGLLQGERGGAYFAEQTITLLL